MGADLERERRGRQPILGLILAPALSAIVWVVLASGGSSLGPTGRVVAVVGVLMAVLWLTEALPVAATALLPIALLPVLSGGELGIREVTAPYANEMIFLFMGGFMLALAMQKWGLHRRIALHIILLVGDRPSSIVLGFMLASGFLSMWISNTATTVMMLPIALSVIALVRQRLGDDAPTGDFAFAIALLLGTAYGASIGGTATLIGTPPNLFMAGFMSDNYGLEITFGDWLPFGLTFAVVMLPLTWLVLTRVVFPIRVGRIPGGRELIREELARCGPMSRQEKAVMVVFGLTALAWVFRSPLSDLRLGANQPLAGLSDAGIAILSSLLLFGLPLGESHRGESSESGRAPPGGRFLLDWPQALKLPWGILLLFGGGLSLAGAVRSSGVDEWIGRGIAGADQLPPLLVIALVTLIVILLTEMTSNAATTATLLPILAAAAAGLGMDPLELVLPATLAASCAFMMPVATPPNAIVFGSGELSIPQMCRAGVWINGIAFVVIVVLTRALGGPVFGLG